MGSNDVVPEGDETVSTGVFTCPNLRSAEVLGSVVLNGESPSCSCIRRGSQESRVGYRLDSRAKVCVWETGYIEYLVL